MKTRDKVFVTITDGATKLLVPTNNGNLEVALVNQYFPSALGLTYKIGNEERVVEKETTYYKPPFETGWGTNQEYVVFHGHIGNKPSHVDKVQRLMEAIRQQKRDCAGGTVANKHKSNITVQKSNKMLKVTKRNKSKTVKLQVGWLHKSGDRYSQMKSPEGGIRVLEVKDSDHLNVACLIDNLQKLFLSTSIYKRENMTCNLGYFNGSIIEDFQNNEGMSCDLFEYFQCKGLVPSKFRCYLLTTIKKEANDTSHQDIQDQDVQNAVDDVLQFPGILPERNISNKQENVTHSLLTDSNVVNNTLLVPLDGMNKIIVQYLKLTKSRYSYNTVVCIYSDENNCIDDLISRQPEIEWSKEQNILSFNFQICNITCQDKCFLNITYNDNLHLFEYEFPSVSGPIVPHAIQHDINELVGLYGEEIGIGVIPSCTNKCNPIFTWYLDGGCLYKEPMMYYLKIFRNGDYSCHIECNESTDKMISMSITVDLFPINENVKEKSVEPTKEKSSVDSVFDVDNSSVHTSYEVCVTTEKELALLLPVVPKSELIFSNTILGCGTQGKVTRGSWLGTDVAIKSIRVSKGAQKTLAIREISVHAKVRHPNIVQIMGCSYTTNTIHLVMELVSGDSLYNILFEDNVKETYKLDNRKRLLIALELCHCQAVNYLHNQQVPIIHRDIKPSNILITPTLTTKICDLGLSKLHKFGRVTKTMGSFAKGTPIYMAPELFFNKQTATIKCDIWSVACTIIELFSEDDVWHVVNDQDDTDEETVLKNKLLNLELPDLTKVPIALQEIIKNCLSYEPNNRPSVDFLLTIIKGMLE